MKRLVLLSLVLLLSMTMVAWAGPRDRATVTREVEMINSILDAQKIPWQAALNPMAFVPIEEMPTWLGLMEQAPSREEFVFDRAQWPAAGQEKKVNKISRVKNQKNCGSCVSFGTTAAFEQTYNVKNSADKYFSERYLFFCEPYPGYGCNSGWSLDGGAKAASNSRKGMIIESQCPYTAFDCGSGCNSGATKYSMPYSSVGSNSFIAALDANRAVIIGMTVYGDFRTYKEGIYEHISDGRLGGHCMVLVGYGTSANNEHYWIIKNSWDTSWGRDGYLYLRIKSEQKLKDSNIEDWGGYKFE